MRYVHLHIRRLYHIDEIFHQRRDCFVGNITLLATPAAFAGRHGNLDMVNGENGHSFQEPCEDFAKHPVTQ
jgi:hypothetical protein